MDTAPQLALSLPVALLMLASATTASAGTWKDMGTTARPRTIHLYEDGVSVAVAMPSKWDLADSGPTSAGKVTVKFAGMRPFTLPNGLPRVARDGLGVGIGKLRPSDARPTVFIAGYTDGAHCCHTVQMASVVRGRVVVDSLPLADGIAMTEFPKDIDGDRVADIRWMDGSLLYEFDGYAGSWHVPRFYNVRHGHPVDVSRKPGFARIYRNFTDKALRSCRHPQDNPIPNGACAAYAYGMAILGKPEQGIRTAVALAKPSDWLPEDCSVEYDKNDNCPKGKEITFGSFEPSLRYLMRKNGYLGRGRLGTPRGRAGNPL
uniref:hypothetical protein n=1 Tax=Altererythrobacter segetis TaxID=1104773 RepID=UPI001A9CA0F8|nr:hypothetical protein [Altererythrobacter segetis]